MTWAVFLATLFFHETKVIIMPFGPSVFLKVILFDKDWLTSTVSVFLCAIFKIKFVSQLLTSVNAQPLSPPIFEKITPHFKQTVFLFFLFYFRVFYFVICLLMFGYRFPPSLSWARLVPCVIVFVSLLFDFGINCRTSKEETTKRCHPSSKKFFCVFVGWSRYTFAKAWRNARSRFPPPPLGHGVLDSNFKFLLVFVRS